MNWYLLHKCARRVGRSLRADSLYGTPLIPLLYAAACAPRERNVNATTYMTPGLIRIAARARRLSKYVDQSTHLDTADQKDTPKAD